MVDALLRALHRWHRERTPARAGGTRTRAATCCACNKRILAADNRGRHACQVYPVLLLYTSLAWLALLS